MGLTWIMQWLQPVQHSPSFTVLSTLPGKPSAFVSSTCLFTLYNYCFSNPLLLKGLIFLTLSSCQRIFLPTSSQRKDRSTGWNEVNFVLSKHQAFGICFILTSLHFVITDKMCFLLFKANPSTYTLVLSPPDFSTNVYHCSCNLSLVYSNSCFRQHLFYFNCKMLSLSY